MDKNLQERHNSQLDRGAAYYAQMENDLSSVDPVQTYNPPDEGVYTSPTPVWGSPTPPVTTQPERIAVHRAYSEGANLSVTLPTAILNGDKVMDRHGNVSTAVADSTTGGFRYIPLDFNDQVYPLGTQPTISQLSELETIQIRSAALEHTINMFRDQQPEEAVFGRTLRKVSDFLFTGSTESFFTNNNNQ